MVTEYRSELCNGIVRTSVNNKNATYTIRDVRVYEVPYVPGFEATTNVNGKPLVEKFRGEANTANSQPEPHDVRMTKMDGKSVVGYTIAGTNVYLDPTSAMPVGADFMGENNLQVAMRFGSIKLNVPISDDLFSYKPAAGAVEDRGTDRGMLKVGDHFPTSNLVSISLLEKAMAKKKNTVILFFDDKNAPCGEMLQKMFEISKHKPKDTLVIGVARTTKWRSMFKGRLNFTVIEDSTLANDSITAKFGVTRYPTLYVLDDQHTATYVQIGSNDAQLIPVLSGLGFSVPQR